MFCNQCEQAAKGTGCTIQGVCGKNPEIAALQDLIIYALQGVGTYAVKAEAGKRDKGIDQFVIEALFHTVTNVDFDPARLEQVIRKAYEVKEQARKAAGAAGATEGPAAWVPAADLAGLVKQGEAHGLESYKSDSDVRSAVEILLFGIKGMAAYMDHVTILGKDDAEICGFFHKALAAIADPSLGLMDYVGLSMECGATNLKVMGLLNEGHVERFGHPVPTPVNTGTKAGKGILITGHDLPMLEAVLKQTEGTGINVYTHGEMLPAHGYPGLKKYAHLAGNFGGAWQDQAKEFPAFSGAIIFNTNCIQRPADSYKDRLFTWGQVGFPGVKHVEGWDFSEVIEKAKASPDLPEAPAKEILVGFGHNTVLGVADKVIEGVKSGAIRHFFLVGGCDGAKPGRNYYTEFAEQVPQDCMILTLACGKYRFNKLDFGDIGGIPRLLDIGQCNDAYSAIKIASALADAFECGVNDLPLSMMISWFEQKATAVLLTLLALGIKGIHLGPTLPAFLTPTLLAVLQEKFDLRANGDAVADVARALGQAA
jgi:hydroxylamine reductase